MPKIVIDYQELSRFLKTPQSIANFNLMIRTLNTLSEPVENLPGPATDLASCITLANALRAALIARTG